MKKPRCTTHKKFRFKKNPDGSVTRICTTCGFKIIDLASGKFGIPIQPIKGRYKKKKDQQSDENVKPVENL
jgi:hypothetical protein